MTNRKLRLSTSLALSVFLGCSAGGVLVIDDASPRYADAQEVDDGYFYSSLAPDGEWFYQAQFGWVWHPTRVDVGWRPYTEGQWVWSDEVGWVWSSQEPWSWATDHYGRWYFDPIHAWTWVPGHEWAPAWVSWREEAGYVGWAPLWPVYFDEHPEYRWDNWGHDHDWDRRHDGRDWDRWVFASDRDFTSERVGRVAVRDRGERDRIFGRSRDVTTWDRSAPGQNGRSIDRRMIEKAMGRPVRAVRLDSADRPGDRGPAGDGSIKVFRPRVQQSRDKTPDRLGFAKEPSKDGRENDTIRAEKQRLDRVPPQDKRRTKDARDAAVREKPTDRGGAPASVERQAEAPRNGRADGAANRNDRAPDSPAQDGIAPAQKGGNPGRQDNGVDNPQQDKAAAQRQLRDAERQQKQDNAGEQRRQNAAEQNDKAAAERQQNNNANLERQQRNDERRQQQDSANEQRRQKAADQNGQADQQRQQRSQELQQQKDNADSQRRAQAAERQQLQQQERATPQRPDRAAEQPRPAERPQPDRVQPAPREQRAPQPDQAGPHGQPSGQAPDGGQRGSGKARHPAPDEPSPPPAPADAQPGRGGR